MKDQEIEVKFHIADLKAFEERLQAAGARLKQARTHEINLRFDTPDGALGRQFRVLRLRHDSATRLTYKGPGRDQEGTRARQEIEFTVSDYQSARAFLEALGFEVTLMYEKFRATYELDGTLVTLDEMPYGSFIEIEGPDPASIRAASQRLGLDWERRVLDSYTMLFERLKAEFGLGYRDLSFENSLHHQPDLGVIGVLPGDQ